MRSRGVPLLLLVGAFVAVARADDVTASSPQTTKVSYADSVEHYRRGDDDLAFKELAALTDADIRIGLQRLLDDLRRMVITTMRDIRKTLVRSSFPAVPRPPCVEAADTADTSDPQARRAARS